MATWRPRWASSERSLRGESRAADEGEADAGVTSLAALRSRPHGWLLCAPRAFPLVKGARGKLDVMTWQPSPELEKQADLHIRNRVRELFDARERAARQVEDDVVRRGIAHSGAHAQLLRKAWAELLLEHSQRVLTDLVGLIERYAELTPESGAWIQGRFDTHVGQLAEGTSRALRDMASRWRTGPTGSIDELMRTAAKAKGRGKLRIDAAVGEAVLKREARLKDAPGGGPEASATLVLEGLHPRIVEVAAKLYRDGHYRQAILDTYIALVEEVRRKSGSSLDNTALMQAVFSQKNPVLVVSDDPDERLGFMWLFTGAVSAATRLSSAWSGMQKTA